MNPSMYPLRWFLMVAVTLLPGSALPGLSEPPPPSESSEDLGLAVPHGFEVTLFSGQELANDIYTLTFDPKGRATVSGKGYIRILEDTDGDGAADVAHPFADFPSDGAMGLWWEGSTLYFTGDQGLHRVEDSDGDLRADGPPTRIRSLVTGDEHGSHAIRRGPDGWLYVICGNQSLIDSSSAETETSPIKDPVAGCLLRFSPDLTQSEVYADGFRNAYDFDFNRHGEIFLFDSDNERDVTLPYYEGERFYQVFPGSHYGWQNPQRAHYWRLPPSFRDTIAPLSDLGRGSPCGVVCYRHTQFPAPYRDGVFLLDWTFGKIWFMPLQEDGATYTCEPEIFLEPIGPEGFAPTDIEVDPNTGDLLVCIGGRGTRGSVYRIRNTEGYNRLLASEITHETQVSQTQPDLPGTLEECVLIATGGNPRARLRALDALLRTYRPDQEQLRKVCQTNAADPARIVRTKVSDLIELNPESARVAVAFLSDHPDSLARMTLAWGIKQADSALAAHIARDILREATPSEPRFEAVRLLQVLLGDLMPKAFYKTVWEGYAPGGDNRLPPETTTQVLSTIRSCFPSGDPSLDRELTRTLALVPDGDRETLARILGRITEDSHPTQDVHFLICLARMEATQHPAFIPRIAHALLDLDRKCDDLGLHRERDWYGRLSDLYDGFGQPSPVFHQAILEAPTFGRPDHLLFAERAGFDREAAASIFVQRGNEDPDYGWTADQVRFLENLPEAQRIPLVRRLIAKPSLYEAGLETLALAPQVEDLPRFLKGLESRDPTVYEACLSALAKIRPDPSPETLATAIRARPPGEAGTRRDDLDRKRFLLLAQLAGLAAPPDTEEGWKEWFRKAHPQTAGLVDPPEAIDQAAWMKRLADIDWSTGDSERGAEGMVRLGCTACHTGSRTLGPDLAGVAQRFSRQDLLTAILDPSRDISSRYQATQVETDEGDTYQGLVVYESQDTLILQDGPTSTVRIAGDSIITRRGSKVSVMPSGLLDQASDRDIADLYRYLQSLVQEP